MDLKDERMLEFLAYEAFLRRAATLDLPFMLKGSFVTRQYFSDPAERIPNDLDWVYSDPLPDQDTARRIFDEWITKVSETDFSDGVKFRSFRENAFWRMMDYAMTDDFPTVNTDLLYWIDGDYSNELSIDVSFNLPIENPPVPLLYKPLRGEPFVIPKTMPLSTQVAWKLHQTMLKARLKDIFDLTHLLKHPDFNEAALRDCLQTLVDECFLTNIDVKNLRYMIEGRLDKFFEYHTIKHPQDPFENQWNFWRGLPYVKVAGMYGYLQTAERVTDPSKLPESLQEFEENFAKAMIEAGFTAGTLNDLPAPKVSDRNDENARFSEQFIFEMLKS